MAQNSKIEWTKHTANLWWGCTEVHAGCDNCYARVLSHRLGGKLWGNDVPRREVKSVWKDLNKYQKLAEAAGEVHRVFVGSMMDIFEKPQPVININGGLVMSGGEMLITDVLRTFLFNDISSGLFPNLMFLFLTKRPSNINKYIPAAWKDNPPANVMFGTSPVNQETADKLIPQLLEAPGRKFLSVEPMLGQIDLVKFLFMPALNMAPADLEPNGMIDWVICGGESGAGKRPFNPDWARSLRDQCKTAGVPFFMKQIDKVQPIPEDLMIREFYI